MVLTVRKPWVGIVTTRLPKPGKGSNARRAALYFARMAQALHGLGAQAMLFVPSDVDWRQGRVLGWVPAQCGKPFDAWERKPLPLPDVIYENVYVHLAVAGYSTDLRRQAARRRIPLFNPVMPGKWHMVNALAKSDCRRYLPPTDRLVSAERAIARIREWGVAYIKPNGGYGGNGVTRVEALGDGKFRISVDRINGKATGLRQIVREAALIKRLNALKLTPHLVQRGLPLMTVGGRKVDFRVVLQRDGRGEWQLVGIVPKLAAADGVVTNLIAGGERVSLDRLTRLAAAEEKHIPVDRLQECAVRIATLLSGRNADVALAGFDLGVDTDNRVWMIEMNPKPARSLLDDAMRRKSARLAAEFATFLAKRSAQQAG